MDHSRETLRMEAIIVSALVYLTSWIFIDKVGASGVVAQVLGAVFFFSYAALIVQLYIDIHETREEYGWPKYWYLYLVLAIIPPMNLVFTVFYLARKHHIRHHEDPVFSPDWWKAIALCAGIWTAVLLIPEQIIQSQIAGGISDPQISFLGDLLILMTYTAWAGLPLSISFDISYLEREYGQHPSLFYLVPAFIPLLSIFTALIYLLERHEKLPEWREEE
jgi:hypothetical protein